MALMTNHMHHFSLFGGSSNNRSSATAYVGGYSNSLADFLLLYHAFTASAVMKIKGLILLRDPPDAYICIK